MLKRELIRVAALLLGGLALGALLGVSPGPVLFVGVPLYGVGIFYAGRSFFRILGRLLGCCAHWQMMGLLFRSLPVSLLSLVLLGVGLAVVCSVGWLLGLLRCAAALVSAAQMDRSLGQGPPDWYD